MDSLAAHLERAEDLLTARKLAECLAGYDDAERSGAELNRCSAGRWMAHMLLGDFESAWKQSDAIGARGGTDPNRFWNGESIEGKCVIVRCLHGFGDSVQFLRYLPMLRERAARVIVEVPPRMLEIAPAFDGVDEIVTWGEQAPETPPTWDVQIEVTELPYFFRTQLGNLPIATNYLDLSRLGGGDANRVLPRCEKPRVGIVWSSGEWNLSRSIRLHELETMFRHSDVEFWNAQGGEVRNEWNLLPRWGSLRDAPEYCGDAGIVPLARFLTELDLIITVDTLAAHLGGALGRPTWVMLQHGADWRWMVNRDDSPWYPSLRLFRQNREGDWSGVVQRLENALARWSSAQRREETVA